jgi:C4-dicarboxylate-specific signal transduction histidine kinase
MLNKSSQFSRFWRSAAVFPLGTLILSGLTLVCFRFHVSSTTVGLLYLIVIVLVSLTGNLISSVLVALIAYGLLDYFFTAPLFTLGMNQPLDFVAPFAYLITAIVINRLISNVRKSNEERKRTEETLRKSQAELAHVTRLVSMGELAASIAHEINQPLTAVVANGSACLRWLAGDSPNLDEARAAARRIVRDGNRADEILKRIRGFLKKTGTKKTRVDINKAIREVVTLAQDEARRHSVTLRMKLASDLPAVLGDRVQLQQVILNLVVNGIEAMASAADESPELHIYSRRHEGDKVLVAVKDFGAGVDQQDVEKLFDPFYSTKANGLGMGLAISKSIVEDHGGRLWIGPDNGLGTTFQFTLIQHGNEQ